jgi:hypothetical protein
MDSVHQPVEEGPRSLFHRAGTFAVSAIVASFVLQFAYSQLWLKLPSDSARLLGFVPTVVIIAAIPAGFIALCGIPKYGVRKLLWKGLAGVVLPIGLFVFSVYYSAYLRTRIAEETAKMEQQSKPAPAAPAQHP